MGETWAPRDRQVRGMLEKKAFRTLEVLTRVATSMHAAQTRVEVPHTENPPVLGTGVMALEEPCGRRSRRSTSWAGPILECGGTLLHISWPAGSRERL